jgi:hypothetical protein
MTLALALTVILVVTFGNAVAFAASREGDLAPAGEIRPPVSENGSGGLCGEGGVEGDPDDLGGGFRSTSGLTKDDLKQVAPPLTPFAKFLFGVQAYWMMIAAAR